MTQQEFENKKVTISFSSALDLFNILTYDEYARAYRKVHAAGFDRRPTYEEYIAACSYHLELMGFDAEVWRSAYDFIADLFDDNERYGQQCDSDYLYQQDIDDLIELVGLCKR